MANPVVTFKRSYVPLGVCEVFFIYVTCTRPLYEV